MEAKRIEFVGQGSKKKTLCRDLHVISRTFGYQPKSHPTNISSNLSAWHGTITTKHDILPKKWLPDGVKGKGKTP